MSDLILQLEFFNEIHGTTPNIKEILNPYILIQSIIHNTQFNLANILEKNYICDGLYIPKYTKTPISRYYPVFAKKIKKLKSINDDGVKVNSNIITEYMFNLSDPNVFFYFKCIGEFKKNIIERLNETFQRFGKASNICYCTFTNAAPIPNVLIGSEYNGRSYILVPKNTCEVMSYRWKNNLGNSCNIQSEGRAAQRVYCLDKGEKIESLFAENYKLNILQLNEKYRDCKPYEVYKFVKNVICECDKSSEISGHELDGTPTQKDHVLIVPLSHTVGGFTTQTNTIMLLFPKHINDDRINNIMLLVDKNFEMGGDDRKTLIRSEEFHKEYYKSFRNYSPIILNNFKEKGRGPKRGFIKLKKLITKSLIKNNIFEDFDLKISSFPYANITDFPDEVISKYGKNKVILDSNKIKISFKEKVLRGPLFIGSGNHCGFGVFLSGGD